MTNIAAVLKSEISRLARKQSRAEIDGLKKVVANQRAEIVSLKRRMQDFEKALKTLSKHQATEAATKPRQASHPDEGLHNARFSAKGFSSNRKRLRLSAAEFALLIGTTQQSILSWESGKTRPRAKFLPAIVELRGIGKREITERLAKLRASC